MPSPALETIKFLTVDEVKRLMRSIESKRDRALFLMAYRHGLRASEVGMLRRSDFDAAQFTLMCHRVKDGLSGVHPVQPDEARLLKSYLRARADDSPPLFLSRNGSPISRVQLHLLMKKYGEAAKLPDDKRHFHCLRHTCGVHLYEATKDIRFVQHWLGHRRIQNTTIYTHLSPSMLEAEARDAFMKLPRF